jgi:hypothetical protein
MASATPAIPIIDINLFFIGMSSFCNKVYSPRGGPISEKNSVMSAQNEEVVCNEQQQTYLSKLCADDFRLLYIEVLSL